MQHYSIGAVSKLTDIPAHTLRKWESRHGIATPLRSESGRRVYTEEHVETLKLIKRLMTAGHALAHLAALDLNQLRELINKHNEPQQTAAVSSIVLVGPTLTKLLANQRIVSQRFDGTLSQWLADSSTTVGSEPIAVESETLPEPIVEQLLELRAQVDRLLVVYSFASSRTLNRLKDSGIDVARSPIDDDELLLRLAPVRRETPAETAQHRFTTQELARIISLNPTLQCECPNHIAKLLMDIASFEKYSQECAVAEPADQALHDQLTQISAQARVMFENALIAVASADGIKLQVNDSRV
ncbi:MAG: MerR family transcriptional regulator [Pseudomonadales bacterium]